MESSKRIAARNCAKGRFFRLGGRKEDYGTSAAERPAPVAGLRDPWGLLRSRLCPGRFVDYFTLKDDSLAAAIAETVSSPDWTVEQLLPDLGWLPIAGTMGGLATHARCSVASPGEAEPAVGGVVRRQISETVGRTQVSRHIVECPTPKHESVASIAII